MRGLNDGEYYKAELQYIDGKSRKFYRVKVYKFETDGTNTLRVKRQWGRIGSVGQAKEEVFPNLRTALSSAKGLVDAKLSKGYELMTSTERPARTLDEINAYIRCEVTDVFGIQCVGHLDSRDNCDNCGTNAKMYREDEMRAEEGTKPQSFAEQFQAFAKGSE